MEPGTSEKTLADWLKSHALQAATETQRLGGKRETNALPVLAVNSSRRESSTWSLSRAGPAWA